MGCRLILDPYVLSYEDLNDDPARLDEFVASLLEWNKLISDWPKFPVFISERTAEVLAEVQGFPVWEKLKPNIEQLGSDYDFRAIVRIYNQMFSCPFLEDELSLKGLVTDECCVVADPELDLEKRRQPFVAILEYLLSLLSLLCQMTDANERNQLLLSKNLPGDTILIQFDVKTVATFGNSDVLKALNGTFVLCQNLRGLLTSIDCAAYWMNGYPEIAVNVESFKRSCESDFHSWVADNNWRFGHGFIETIDKLHFSYDKAKIAMVLRAVAETISRMNLRDTHALRTGAGPGDPQRTRGSDKAWRRDIDHQYRLHYWETQDGIELGSVAVHGDFTIPY